MEVWGTKMINLPSKSDRSVIRAQIGRILTADTPNMNGRIYPRDSILRALERLRVKKAPLQELTERVFNDDYDVEVEDPTLAAALSKEVRRVHPTLPRFTISKLKLEEDALIINFSFDAPVDASAMQLPPLSISSRGTIRDDGTVDIDE